MLYNNDIERTEFQVHNNAKSKLFKPFNWKRRYLKLKHKLILACSLAALITGSTALAGYQTSLSRFYELLYEQTAISLGAMANELSERARTLASLSSQTALNPIVQQSLMALAESEDPMERRRARSAITEELYRYLEPGVICVSILLEDGSSIACGLDSSPESPETVASLKKAASLKYGGEAWTQSGRPDGSALCAREIRKSSDPYFLKTLGYLVYRVDLSDIARSISNDYGMEKLIVADWQGNLLYPADGEMPEHDLRKGYAIHLVDGKEMFFTGKRLYDISPPWDIIAGVSCESIISPIRRTALLTVAMILGGFALSLALAALFSHSISRKFQVLLGKMNRLKSGQFEVAESAGFGGDELGLLNQHFDEMALEFKKMIDESYVKQLLIAQTRLKLLQQQINPHFLFNTLESINWFAKRSGEENIRVMVESLGCFLRGNLDSQDDGLVTLANELSVLESYLKIQMIRYRDMLEVDYAIDRDVLGTLLPRLSLQPLVENAITYSMEESMDGCKISVSAKRVNGDALVCVENTGSEIDCGILEKLRNKEAKAAGHGIGLLSIDERVKLLFGPKYGLSFESGPELTVVKLLLPYNEKGGDANA
jgi:two-component system sensor histidine kinase YesM